MTLKRIHVNQHVIKSNNVNDEDEPAITIKTSKDNVYCHEVDIQGPSKLVYRKKKPLSCGAVMWIETESKLVTNNGTVIK